MVLLAIDPGRSTGYALIEFKDEKVIEAGCLARTEPFFRERMKAVMARADRMAIEDQFIKTGKDANNKTVRKIIEAKQEAICFWVEVHGGENVPIQYQPTQWQRSLGFKGKTEQRKRASRFLASSLTRRTITAHDMADAMNIGLHAVREIKFTERIT